LLVGASWPQDPTGLLCICYSGSKCQWNN
jgi:hypothetical protein